MDTQEILTEISSIISKTLNKTVTVDSASTAADVDGWDSLTNMIIINSIEKKFAVKFKLGEIMKFNRVGDIVATIQSKVN